MSWSGAHAIRLTLHAQFGCMHVHKSPFPLCQVGPDRQHVLPGIGFGRAGSCEAEIAAACTQGQDTPFSRLALPAVQPDIRRQCQLAVNQHAFYKPASDVTLWRQQEGCRLSCQATRAGAAGPHPKSNNAAAPGASLPGDRPQPDARSCPCSYITDGSHVRPRACSSLA